MASENLAKLQATLNRFASEVGFSPLAIDGGMGEKTAHAAFATIGWVGGSDGCVTGSDGADLCAHASEVETARDLVVQLVGDNGVIDNTRLMNANVGVNTFLSLVADHLQLQAAANVALVHPSTGIVADKSAFHVTPPLTMGSFDKARLWFRQQPMVMQAGIGLGGGLILLAAFHGLRGKKSSGTARRR